MTEEAEVLFERRGALGLITLNRPKALNALTQGMCVAMKAQLDEWAKDDAFKSVAIRGNGDRAFCAGGDIRALYESGKAKTPYALQFYRDEYILNATIKRYPKPYIALIHGIDMGGGVGVSVNGSHRIAGESMVFAMPETGIGLFPDVGGSYFLPRCPGQLGMFLGLTGARLKTTDSLYAGIATDFVPMAHWEMLLAALADGTAPDTAIAGLKDSVPDTFLGEHRDAIDRTFGQGSVEDILAALDEEHTDWAQDTANTIRAKSPTSLKIAFRQIREGKSLSFDECMKMEYRMVNRIVAGHDFYEGVRAVIIDKDNAPKWQPAALSGVSDKDVDAYFAPLGEEELEAMSNIAFIGVGNMGGPMARNLLKAGHQVTAFDLNDTVLDPVLKAGAQKGASANAAVKDADAVITMLPAGHHVRAVYLDNGVLGAAKKGALLIDSSTIDVDSARAVHTAAEKAGFLFLDAPVSGGTGGAEAGTLTFMCGGSDAAFEQAKPVLEKMGKKIAHAGGPGAGQAAKICNNMMLGISMIGTCEALALGEKLGLEAQKLFDIMSTSSGQSWSLTTYCPVPGPVPTAPSNRDYAGGFATALMLKDLKLAQTAAQSVGANTPLGAEAAQLYSLFAAAGNAGIDFSGIIRMLRGKA